MFYNGKQNIPDVSYLRLSDSFAKVSDLGKVFNNTLELEVKVYNINNAQNVDDIKNCRPLTDYNKFVKIQRKGF